MLARLVCATALLAAGAASAADPTLSGEPPFAGGIPDVVGPRALALSAATGIASGNEGVFLNPATVGVRRRYEVGGGLLVDRRGSETTGQFFGGSVVDSLTSSVAAGVSYFRAYEGFHTGNFWVGTLSGPIAEQVHLGVSAKYLNVDAEEAGLRSSDAVTVDAGLFWQVAELVSFGAAGYNLVSISNDSVAPMGAGVGLAIGNDQSFQVTGDWRVDFDRRGETSNRYSAGVEVLLGNAVPVRAGWMKDELLETDWWSAGAGLVSKSGVALDIGYRQSLDDPDARTIAATIKLFLFR